MEKTVSVIKNNQLCLMINEIEKTIFCLCESAFLSADLIGFSTKKLRKDIDSLVIYEDGRIQKIIKIEKKELLGDSLFDKIASFLLGAYRIDVTFSNVNDMPIEKIKELLKEIINSNEFAYDYFLINENDKKAKKIILNNLIKAKTYKDIINAFECTSKDECLDSL